MCSVGHMASAAWEFANASMATPGLHVRFRRSHSQHRASHRLQLLRLLWSDRTALAYGVVTLRWMPVACVVVLPLVWIVPAELAGKPIVISAVIATQIQQTIVWLTAQVCGVEMHPRTLAMYVAVMAALARIVWVYPSAPALSIGVATATLIAATIARSTASESGVGVQLQTAAWCAVALTNV